MDKFEVNLALFDLNSSEEDFKNLSSYYSMSLGY